MNFMTKQEQYYQFREAAYKKTVPTLFELEKTA